MTRASLRIDVEEWTHQLVCVWKPTRILAVRNQGTLGLLFIARVPSGLTLHLRVQWTGVDTCALWRGSQHVLWDSVIGFLPTTQTSPVPKEQEERQMRELIQRNCFLMGCDVMATDEEKRQWLEEIEASKNAELVQNLEGDEDKRDSDFNSQPER